MTVQTKAVWQLRTIGIGLCLTGCLSGGRFAATDDTSAGLGPEQSENPPTLCDGSADVRLVVKSGGGMVDPGDDFLHPLGSTFLSIDGTCRYLVYDGSGPLRTGTLSQAQSQQIAADLAYGRLSELAADHDTCPDAGGTSIRTPWEGIGCSCGCSDPTTDQVVLRAWDLVTELWDAGVEKDWALSAATDGPSSPGPNTLAWPLDWPVTELALYSLPEHQHDLVGTAIEKSEDRAALRQLRSEWLAGKLHPNIIYVVEDGMEYDLLLREELPQDAAEALERFRALETPYY